MDYKLGSLFDGSGVSRWADKEASPGMVEHIRG